MCAHYYSLYAVQKGLNVFPRDLTNTITSIPFGISLHFLYLSRSLDVFAFQMKIIIILKRKKTNDKKTLSIFRSNYNIICIFRLLYSFFVVAVVMYECVSVIANS